MKDDLIDRLRAANPVPDGTLRGAAATAEARALFERIVEERPAGRGPAGARLGPSRFRRALVPLAVLVAIGVGVPLWLLGPLARDETGPEATLPGGRIVFGCGEGICAIDPDGSNPEVLIGSAGAELQDPVWSPDGTRLAYSCALQVCVADADGGDSVQVTHRELLFATHLTWSPEGETIAFEGVDNDPNGLSHILVVTADGGAPRRITGSHFQHPAWSPDGTRIAAHGRTESTQGPEVFVMDADGRHRVQLTNGASIEDGLVRGGSVDPAWSPDGLAVAHVADVPDRPEIRVMNPDGTEIRSVATIPGAEAISDPAWSPDGSWIVFQAEVDGNQDLWMVGVDGSGLQQLTDTPGNEFTPSWGDPRATSP